MKRREFLTQTGIGALAAGAVVAGCDTSDQPHPIAIDKPPPKAPDVKYKWKMVTTWPPEFPIFQTGAAAFAQRVNLMSGGRIEIKIFAGGELVPPLEVFDAVSAGTVELGHSAAYYWAGKAPAAQFFTAVPFGFTAQQMNAWLYHGGGLELWREIYEPHNLVPFPIANSGVQMGGWFNKEINSVADLEGLKIRMPGLGGKVLTKAGANVILLPASELYTALERGVIDALEWVGPYHDMLLGLHQIARHYYYPGWHEPGSTIELMINKRVWDHLPPDLQAVIRAAAAESNMKSLAEFDTKNSEALKQLKEQFNVDIRIFPDDVLETLHRFSAETIDELATADPNIRKVNDHFVAFAKKVNPWTTMSEGAYMRAAAL